MKYEELSKDDRIQFSNDIENRLWKLISSLKVVITNKTIEEATEYLEHREWGICLQTLGYDYIELKTPINEDTYNEMVSLCELMEMPNDESDCWFYEKLIERHAQE